MKVVLGTIDDVPAIHSILKRSLLDVQDIDELSTEGRNYFEERGFLRKEVPPSFYRERIEDENSAIYVLKEYVEGEIHNNIEESRKNTIILGFASIYKSKSNVYEFRSTLKELFPKTEEIKDLLTNPSSYFLYLDQIAVLPEYQRNNVATQLLQAIEDDTDLPIVAFVVTKPLMNKASIRWHEKNGFILAASCNGEYKDEKLEWNIYLK
ncbi:MAG: GNAT family N-acetyltransferase [Candidatus Lokiarchaeota archaeon]|nr:GNAT family N-acetyltransferase [Candidatus Lokiarchaeota archaeon]